MFTFCSCVDSGQDAFIERLISHLGNIMQNTTHAVMAQRYEGKESQALMELSLQPHAFGDSLMRAGNWPIFSILHLVVLDRPVRTRHSGSRIIGSAPSGRGRCRFVFSSPVALVSSGGPVAPCAPFKLGVVVGQVMCVAPVTGVETPAK